MLNWPRFQKTLPLSSSAPVRSTLHPTVYREEAGDVLMYMTCFDNVTCVTSFHGLLAQYLAEHRPWMDVSQPHFITCIAEPLSRKAAADDTLPLTAANQG